VKQENLLCPHCDHKLFEVYFEDQIRRWRCVYCHRLISEKEYELRGDEQQGYELLKRPIPRLRKRRVV